MTKFCWAFVRLTAAATSVCRSCEGGAKRDSRKTEWPGARTCSRRCPCICRGPCRSRSPASPVPTASNASELLRAAQSACYLPRSSYLEARLAPDVVVVLPRPERMGGRVDADAGAVTAEAAAVAEQRVVCRPVRTNVSDDAMRCASQQFRITGSNQRATYKSPCA